MFDRLLWHLAKKRFAAPLVRVCPRSVTVSRVMQQAKVEDFTPNTDPYGRLASCWDEYAGWFVPGYGRFLDAAGRHYQLPVRRVLDLACGTGLLTRQVAARAETVVGLDASWPMLRKAAVQTQARNIGYVQGDFRNFRLEESFDAAMCGSDSLNYLETPGELKAVFGCVGRCLRPGGIFVFDALDEGYFLASMRFKYVVRVRQERFDMYEFYDEKEKVSETRVVFKDAVERHRRIPIGKDHVFRAADEAGLAVAEHFTSLSVRLRKRAYCRPFYLLRKPGL
jgi:SAM-dependent methyltransferase